MRVLSLNVGQPRPVVGDGEIVHTGIFKYPVTGRRTVGKLNIDGDGQADLRSHGGVGKAVYAYPAEYYAYWRNQYPGIELSWGAFGENLTVEGLLDDQLHIGDRLAVGTAELRVTQPRIPCYKLGIRLGRPDVVRRFVRSAYCGFYLAVDRVGEMGAGDSISVIAAVLDAPTVAHMFRRSTGDAPR